MKKQILLSIILLPVCITLLAQDDWNCGTDTRKVPFLRPQGSIGLRSDTAVLYIPVTANLVGTDAGVGHYAVSKLLDALCKLNTDFEGHGFHFYLENLNYLNSSTFYDMSSTYLFSEEMYQFIKDHNTLNTMNIYLVQQAGGYSFVSWEDWAGWDYTVYPPTLLLTQGEGVVLDMDHLNSLNHLFTHEVGHFLGLYHTFNWVEDWAQFSISGTPDTAYYDAYDPDNDTTLTLPWIVSRVDGFNCDLSGDLICDTPPDYMSGGFQCNGNQESNTVQTDPVGMTFQSDGTFYMSYSNDACQNRFSPQQVEVMRAVAEGPKSYLLYDQTLPGELAASDMSLIYPAENDTIQVSGDSITLQWEMPGAEYFFVTCRISTPTGGQFTLLSNKPTDTTWMKVKTYEDRTYFWEVRGANSHFYCPDIMAASQFYAVEGPSSTNESAQTGALTFSPNPANDFLNFQLPETAAATLDVQVFDAQGRLVLLANGQRLDVQALAAGMYSLKVVVGERVFAGKFVKI